MKPVRNYLCMQRHHFSITFRVRFTYSQKYYSTYTIFKQTDTILYPKPIYWTRSGYIKILRIEKEMILSSQPIIALRTERDEI